MIEGKCMAHSILLYGGFFFIDHQITSPAPLQVKAEREAPDSIDEMQKNTEEAAKDTH